MSLFDPLYQIEATEPPTLEEINKTLQEFDGSGSGLMTAKQMYAACQAVNNLGFTPQELQNYVKEGMDVAGDGNGKIKMAEFASYLAFEAKKKYKKSQSQSNGGNVSNGNNQAQSNGADYVNPFLDFISEDQPVQNGQSPYSQSPSSPKGMKITLTPDPHQSKQQAQQQSVDMSDAYSPTTADPTDLPNWFGHSQNTITTHPNEPTADPFGGLFDDDNKQNETTSYKPMHVSVATQDILFEDDLLSSSSNGVNRAPNLSPKNAQKLKTKSKHGASKTATGLIAPPRAKGDNAGAAKLSKKRSSKKLSNKRISASFTNVFGDLEFEDDSFEVDESEQKKRESKLKLKKANSEMIPESTHKLVSRSNDEAASATTDNVGSTSKPAAAKRKRPKIDAIVEMKRGAAMLKYGRRGFPHFRRFQISHDLTKLLWYSRKKSLQETHVAVAEMKDILDGQQTEVFKQCTQKTLEKASFSIIYGTKLKSLDVVAKSAEEAQLWIKGLKGLIKANQQGKLHKVVQILVDVDYKDITKTKYRQCSDDERRKYEVQHKNRPELVHTITTTLQQSHKIFQSMLKLSQSNNVQNSNEYENIQTLTSEIEERLEEIEYGLDNKTADLQDLKRDVWVLKVDVTVLEEKVKVLSKIKTAIPI